MIKPRDLFYALQQQLEDVAVIESVAFVRLDQGVKVDVDYYKGGKKKKISTDFDEWAIEAGAADILVKELLKKIGL